MDWQISKEEGMTYRNTLPPDSRPSWSIHKTYCTSREAILKSYSVKSYEEQQAPRCTEAPTTGEERRRSCSSKKHGKRGDSPRGEEGI